MSEFHYNCQKTLVDNAKIFKTSTDYTNINTSRKELIDILCTTYPMLPPADIDLVLECVNLTSLQPVFGIATSVADANVASGASRSDVVFVLLGMMFTVLVLFLIGTHIRRKMTKE